MIQFEKFTLVELRAMYGSELEQYSDRGEAFRYDLSRGVIYRPAGQGILLRATVVGDHR